MRYFSLYLLCSLLFTSVLYAQSGKPSVEETQKNIAVLQDIFKSGTPTDAQFFAASQAVQKLTETGTADAVPELTKLLAVEQMNTIVRTALVNMPEKTGIAALRESLATLQGKNLAGVIESLGAERDTESVPALIKLTGSADAVVAQAAVLALGKIATPEAVSFLCDKFLPTQVDDVLSPENENHRKAVHALLIAANRLAAEGKKEQALTIYNFLAMVHSMPNVQIPAVCSAILLGGKDGDEATFAQYIRQKIVSVSKDVQWKVALETANKLKSPKTSQIILDNFGSQPNEHKAALLEVIGNRNDPGDIDLLIGYAAGKGDSPVMRIAAVKALGKLNAARKSIRGLEVLLDAAVDADAALAAAGNQSLLMLQGKEFNAEIVKLLAAPQKAVRLAALNVIAGRGITEAKEKVKPLLTEPDETVRLAAYKAFSQIADTAADFAFLLEVLNHLNGIPDDGAGKPSMGPAEWERSREELKIALKVVCEKTPERDGCVTVLAKTLDTVSKPDPFLLELLQIIGGEKAGKAVVKAAKSSNVPLADKATEILGKWRTGEIADDLYDIAKTHPNAKFRQRAIGGYIRIIRQLSGHLPPEKQLEMIAKAEKLATREEHKAILAAAKEKVLRLSKGTLLFNGKTFDGWEFRGNESWFRIEDGAVVAGSLKKPIPQNEFICTKKEYGDFTLRLEIKVLDSREGGGGEANAGVQFRSQRTLPDSKKPNEVIGYQADMTASEKFWGSLYDESRRGKFLAEANREEVKSVFRPNDWNEMEIVCKGANVKIFVNGKQTIDYTEADANIPRKGIIGLQIHSARPSEAWYRNVRIEER